MKTIRIYSSIWRREFLIGILCVAFAVMICLYDVRRILAILFFGLTGFYLLFDTFADRLLHRPRLTITDECIVINRRWHKEETIRFDEIKSFERERLRIWKYSCYTGMIIVHLVNGRGFVNMISADRLAIKNQVLFDLLNERLRASHRRSATSANA